MTKLYVKEEFNAASKAHESDPTGGIYSFQRTSYQKCTGSSL
jgi:hypothetical protein